MVLNFHIVTDDPRVVRKTLGTAVHSIQNASVYEDCSIMTPRFLVDYSASLITTNYVAAPLWGRYYFVRDFVAMPGGRCLVICDEDVLMGNADDIYNLTANVIRTGDFNRRNRYIIDSKYTAKSDTRYEMKKFSGGVNFNANPTGHCYIMTVIGGIHTSQNRGDSNAS